MIRLSDLQLFDDTHPKLPFLKESLYHKKTNDGFHVKYKNQYKIMKNFNHYETNKVWAQTRVNFDDRSH